MEEGSSPCRALLPARCVVVVTIIIITMTIKNDAMDTFK